MNKATALKEHHKIARLKWASDFVSSSDDLWSRIFFSDEKKWNLDGRDGLKSYLHCLRRQPKTAFSRQNGGGSVMVWGAFCANGTTDLVFLEGNQKAEDYIDTLSHHLLPVAFGHFGSKALFQQDNASIHTAKSTVRFLDEVGMPLIPWPAISPDLNPIENIWGKLTQEVYPCGKQYNSIEDLKTAILSAWAKLYRQYLQKLVSGMKERCIKVLRNGGGHIDM